MLAGASAAMLTTLPKSAQLALRKFYLRTGFPSVNWTNDGIVIGTAAVVSKGICPGYAGPAAAHAR